jgi:hypothetical protein
MKKFSIKALGRKKLERCNKLTTKTILSPKRKSRCGARNRFQEHLELSCRSELVFLNVYGAQESIPRHQFRQPM